MTHWQTNSVRLAAIIMIACAGTVLASERIDLPDGSSQAGALHTRNASIQVGDHSSVEGSISSRNGSIRLGIEGSYADVGSRNGSISIGDRSQVGAVETRNGSISLGEQVRAGTLSTRNGSITIGAGSEIDGLVHTRNGSIRLGQDSQIAADVRTRNGRIALASDSLVAGDASTRNGNIELISARVTGSLRSRSGDLVLRQSGEVGADVVIEVEPVDGGWFSFLRSVQYGEAGNIRILDDSTVHGDVIVRLPANYNETFPTVEIAESARVLGKLLVDHRVELIVDGSVSGDIERIRP